MSSLDARHYKFTEILWHMLFDIIFGEKGKKVAEDWDKCTAQRDASGQQKEDDRALAESQNLLWEYCYKDGPTDKTPENELFNQLYAQIHIYEREAADCHEIWGDQAFYEFYEGIYKFEK